MHVMVAKAPAMAMVAPVMTMISMLRMTGVASMFGMVVVMGMAVFAMVVLAFAHGAASICQGEPELSPPSSRRLRRVTST